MSHEQLRKSDDDQTANTDRKVEPDLPVANASDDVLDRFVHLRCRLSQLSTQAIAVHDLLTENAIEHEIVTTQLQQVCLQLDTMRMKNPSLMWKEHFVPGRAVCTQMACHAINLQEAARQCQTAVQVYASYISKLERTDQSFHIPPVQEYLSS